MKCYSRLVLILKRLVSLLSAIFVGSCSDVAADQSFHSILFDFQNHVNPAREISPLDVSPELLAAKHRIEEAERIKAQLRLLNEASP